MNPTSSTHSDDLQLGGQPFQSRLLMGTGRFSSPQLMLEALKAAESQIITVSIRRMNLSALEDTFLSHAEMQSYQLLPNTAGCYTAKDAILTAELARESLQTNWIKVEVIGDDQTLLPDSVELLAACQTLVQEGFIVLPYCTDDPILCQRLADIGCAAVMPLAAPIGSGLGIRNPHNLQLIRNKVQIPVIVDAGIGTASDAALAMELGCDAILLNTAVADAMDPVRMAAAMRYAVLAGRNAYCAGRMPKNFMAQASSPMLGRIHSTPS
jgi:thiazole synthase